MQIKKFTVPLVLAMGFFFKSSQAQSPENILAYIARYKDLAMAEMKRTGIPAAITLAQGIHETDAGTSELVRKSNNHFGIKCKDNWTGESVFHDDDARGECFRKYSAPEDSYRDHSDFLKTRSNYTSLFQLDPTDYQAWAYGLKKAGYATNPKYAQILIKLIEDYHLQDYTMIALGKMVPGDDYVSNAGSEKNKNAREVIATNNPVNSMDVSAASDQTALEEKTHLTTAAVISTAYPEGEFKINETRVVYIKKGTSYLTVAQQYEISLARLFEFNDIQQQEIADCDQLVFIQRKRKVGDHESHIVQPGETLSNIAQTEALRLESLLEYNNLNSSMQPAVGETLSLRSKSSSMPRLAKSSVVNR